MKELTKSEEQMMDIFWDSKEALTSVDIVKMQVKATWTNGLVHKMCIRDRRNGDASRHGAAVGIPPLQYWISNQQP